MPSLQSWGDVACLAIGVSVGHLTILWLFT